MSLIDYNPYLNTRRQAGPVDTAPTPSDTESIEQPDMQNNIPWQTRPAPPSEYEAQLCSTLEALFVAGVEDITGLVDGLNRKGLKTATGESWTQALFEHEMKRLGA